MNHSNDLEPMQHDGIPICTPVVYPNPAYLNTNQSAPPATADSNIRNASPSPRAGPSRRSSLQNNVADRILSPVAGCPESLRSSIHIFQDFKGIRKHLTAHCSGQLSGAIPLEFLRQYDYSLCNVCGKILHKNYNSICQKCRPQAHRQSQVDAMRNNHRARLTNQQRNSSQTADSMPNLLDIQKQFVPTIRNIPLCLRRLWAQCLSKSLAQATFANDITS